MKPYVDATMLPDRSPSPELSPLAVGEDLSPLPILKSAGTAELDFSGLLSTPLRLHEDLAQGCGGQLWPPGMILAKHMLRYHREDLRQTRMWVSRLPHDALAFVTADPDPAYAV